MMSESKKNEKLGTLVGCVGGLVDRVRAVRVRCDPAERPRVAVGVSRERKPRTDCCARAYARAHEDVELQPRACCVCTTDMFPSSRRRGDRGGKGEGTGGAPQILQTSVLASQKGSPSRFCTTTISRVTCQHGVWEGKWGGGGGQHGTGWSAGASSTSPDARGVAHRDEEGPPDCRKAEELDHHGLPPADGSRRSKRQTGSSGLLGSMRGA